MPGWLIRCAADVPAGDAWLSARERRTGAGLRVRRRRRDWRLGRFAAKAAVGSWLSVAPERVEILPAPDGAPEAWVDGERAPVSVSLSHRAGRALAGAGAKDGTWRALRVQWDDGCAPTEGWWRAEPGWVMTIAGDPAPPRPIDAPRAPAGG